MNAFRLIGDMSHLLAIIVLLVKILRTKSVCGLSGVSQVFYAVVFTTRYLDLFTNFISFYNTVMKCLYIFLTYLTVVLTFYKYKDTYNRKKDPKKFYFLLIPCAIFAFLINHEFTFMEILWTFSIYLEAVAIVPQLAMLHKTGECESITMHYIFLMGLYRAFYIANWIYRYNAEGFFDIIAIVSGVIQTLIYCPFFYMYATKVVRGDKYKVAGYLQLEQNDLLETRNEVVVVSSNVDDKPQGKVDIVVKNEISDETQAVSV